MQVGVGASGLWSRVLPFSLALKLEARAEPSPAVVSDPHQAILPCTPLQMYFTVR